MNGLHTFGQKKKVDVVPNILKFGHCVNVSNSWSVTFFQGNTLLCGSRSNFLILCERKWRLGEQTYGQQPHVHQFPLGRLCLILHDTLRVLLRSRLPHP